MCWPLRSLSLPIFSVLILSLSACGGGGAPGTASDALAAVVGAAPTPPVSVPAPPADPVPPQQPAPEPDPPAETLRRGAASATASSHDNACAAIRPFYWEVGDRSAALAGGAVRSTSTTTTITADTELLLASATKWLYAAYVVQRRGGQPAPWDITMLTQRSGYVSFLGCRNHHTVDECLAWQDNDGYTPAADGRFFYDGGHFQKHASLLGLGAMSPAELASEWRTWLGEDLAFDLAQARPGGGARGTAAGYARFLRKLMTDEFSLGPLLGSSAVCASPDRCPTGEALSGPGPANEAWHYSLGHWVEDDPELGDGSFSSAGAFGFYPWVSADRQLYGLVSRLGPAGSGESSFRCGRLIRQAWKTGVAQ